MVNEGKIVDEQRKKTVATNPLIDIRNGRLAKVTALRSAGLNPYPSRSGRTHYAKAILDEFAKHEGQTVTVAGRLMSWRKQGALTFAHLQDQTGRLQLFLRRNLVQATDPADGRVGYAETNLLDLGDIIEATGKVVRTERGEISVLVERLRLLTKAIRPTNGPVSKIASRCCANVIWTPFSRPHRSTVFPSSAKWSRPFALS
jgi:lysyl-tRNA synthetase class II